LVRMLFALHREMVFDAGDEHMPTVRLPGDAFVSTGHPMENQ